MTDIPSLWPVVVGGLIGVTGSAIGSAVLLLTKAVERFDQKQKGRAEKFEELVELVYKFDHWIDRKQNAVVFQEKAEIEISPLARIEAVAAVHFPDHIELVTELAIAARGFQLWTYEAAQRRAADPNTDINSGLSAAYSPYLQKRNALLEALRKLAREEFAQKKK